MIVTKVDAFLDSPQRGEFGALALEVFEHQYRQVPAYRRLCDHRDRTPGSVVRWQDVPMVPTTAFKTTRLSSSPARVVFRSSGTTQGERRSVHEHPFPGLYRRVIDASFPVYCLTDLERPSMLSLIPSREQVPDSSLSFMVDHVLERFAGPGSLTAFGDQGVAVDGARAWLEASAADGRPVMVLTTALALLQCLEGLAAIGARISLPGSSVLFETGGFKGHRLEVDRPRLLAMTEEHLGLPPSRVVREYGMTELTSQAYGAVLNGGDPDVLRTPHWLEARVLDPVDLQEVSDGESGLLSFFDLGNVGSVAHVMTEDLGIRDADGGFRLLGRATGAELRGCSLTAEELASSP